MHNFSNYWCKHRRMNKSKHKCTDFAMKKKCRVTAVIRHFPSLCAFVYVCVLPLRYVRTDHKDRTTHVFVQWKHQFQIGRVIRQSMELVNPLLLRHSWKPGLTLGIFFCRGFNQPYLSYQAISVLRLLKLFISLKLQYLQIDFVSFPGIFTTFCLEQINRPMYVACFCLRRWRK